MKEYSLFVFLACILTGNLLANGIMDVSHIPAPDVQIELPRELTGAFEFIYEDPYGINHDFYGWIEIYENNKYWWRGDSGQEWGNIIEENGDYYLLPLGSRAYNIKDGYYIREKTKITFTENGFSFTGTGMGNREFVTVRKRENIE
jgi:hypothetical protein